MRRFTSLLLLSFGLASCVTHPSHVRVNFKPKAKQTGEVEVRLSRAPKRLSITINGERVRGVKHAESVRILKVPVGTVEVRVRGRDPKFDKRYKIRVRSGSSTPESRIQVELPPDYLGDNISTIVGVLIVVILVSAAAYFFSHGAEDH